jgi:2-C-methyl-D-erythritol 2,4-cyclodiphosphate synthase
MLAKAVSQAARRGYRVGNVDAVVIAEAPKLAPYRDAMRKTIAKLLNISIEDVQVKGKTNEGLDAIGRGQAIAAHAVVLLYDSSHS